MGPASAPSTDVAAGDIYGDGEAQVGGISTRIAASGSGVVAGGEHSAVYAVGVVVAQRIGLAGGRDIRPLSQLVLDAQDGATFADRLGNAVDVGSDSGLTGRLRPAHQLASADLGEDARHLLSIGTVLHDVTGTREARFAGVPLARTNDATGAEIGFGGSVALDGSRTCTRVGENLSHPPRQIGHQRRIQRDRRVRGPLLTRGGRTGRCPPRGGTTADARRPAPQGGRVRVSGAGRTRRASDWLGRQDSNLESPVPKTVALPLGHAPTVRRGYGSGGGLASGKSAPRRRLRPARAPLG